MFVKFKTMIIKFKINKFNQNHEFNVMVMLNRKTVWERRYVKQERQREAISQHPINISI